MKRFAYALMSFCFLGQTAYSDALPKTVENLDLESYSGLWYEISSTQPFFQRGCVCNTADYTALADGSLKVENSCRLGALSAEPRVTVGSAVPTEDPGKLAVSFGEIASPIANYWVVDLAEDYSYAVVTTPLRWPVWVLSRTPEMGEDALNTIYNRLEADGFSVGLMRPTLQEGCWQ